MEYDAIFEDMWEAKENECLHYVKNDVLSTSFCYARYTKSMEKLTNLDMKKSITLLSLPNKFFISLRDENDKPFYTNTDPYMRKFVRNSIKGGRCNAFNQQNLKLVMRFLKFFQKKQTLTVTYVIF